MHTFLHGTFAFCQGGLSVATAPWQRCYGPVATLLWARGNVAMGPWQRCYGPVATHEALCTNTYKPCKRGNKGLKIAQRDGGAKRANWFHPPTFILVLLGVVHFDKTNAPRMLGIISLVSRSEKPFLSPKNPIRKGLNLCVHAASPVAMPA